MQAQIDSTFWYAKRVYLTGHTGFKGSWLATWLQSMGAKVKGFALEPPTKPSLFNEARVADGMESDYGDIRDLEQITRSMTAFNPDILIHMAAQPLVRLSYHEPVTTYATNVMGTVNVFEAARQCTNLRCIVNITTDKCYENREWEWGYRENDPMGGHDPYSSSKGCAELVTAAYRNSYFNSAESPALASVRAGNVIGGGDWAEDRLIPDILRAFAKGEPVVIRNPLATRPWQHVLEPLSGYLLLAQKLWEHGPQSHFADGWNFGPRDEDVQTVEWILNHMVAVWGEGARWQLDSNPQPHEARYLKLDISRARSRLGWGPVWTLSETLERIVTWQRGWLDAADVRTQCLQEVEDYLHTMNSETE